jgi:hypothetical protein
MRKMPMILLLLLIGASCSGPRVGESEGPASDTKWKLQAWERLLTEHFWAERLEKCTALEDCLNQLRGQWPEEDKNWLCYDGWGSPFHWHLSMTSEGVRVRITSAGANKTFEDSQGDDLWIEIEFKNGKPVTRSNLR